MWVGKKSILKYLRIFGNICYAFVLEIKQEKMDKIDVGILAGYSNNSRRHKVY